jgi:hypothetical protein
VITDDNGVPLPPDAMDVIAAELEHFTTRWTSVNCRPARCWRGVCSPEHQYGKFDP